MPRTHHLPDRQVHFTWDTGNAPVLDVGSGDTVVVWTRDVSDNQIGPDSDASVIAGLDWDRVYPLAGPIAVNGAQPGDTLAIEILDIHTQGWGWTAILPGLGLLPDDFPDASLRFSLYKGRAIPGPQYRTPAPLTRRVDSAPFYGTTGVGADLYVAAQDAVRAMVDHISSDYELGREDAYLLCSLAVDLKISEIVDAGQYIVSAVLPEAIFSS